MKIFLTFLVYTYFITHIYHFIKILQLIRRYISDCKSAYFKKKFNKN